MTNKEKQKQVPKIQAFYSDSLQDDLLRDCTLFVSKRAREYMRLLDVTHGTFMAQLSYTNLRIVENIIEALLTSSTTHLPKNAKKHVLECFFIDLQGLVFEAFENLESSENPEDTD